jgi:hypothetical protein
MNIDLRPFLVLEIVLALIVIALIVWRKAVARNEDDTLHMMDGAAAQQAIIADKLEKIDRWGKISTVLAIVFGLALAVLYIYQNWVRASMGSGA